MLPDSPKLVAERDHKLAALGPCPPWWRPFKRRAWKRSRLSIMAMDCSQMAEMFRKLYPPEAIEQALSPSPALSMIGQVESFKGGSFAYTVVRKDEP